MIPKPLINDKEGRHPFPDYYEISDYGLIGDLHTIALINHHGGIDWCCVPYFDSPSLFAKILDTHRGGSFKIYPSQFTKSSSRYVDKTNILETTFENNDSRLVLTDFMPISTDSGAKAEKDEVYICRQVECEKGNDIEVSICLDPQPDYGRKDTTLHFQPKKVVSKDLPITILFDRPIRWNERTRMGSVILSYGQTLHCIFYYGRQDLEIKPDYWVEKQFYKTRKFWEKWVAQSLYSGRWRQAVQRSALALKLMMYKPSGAIIAAPTASLPEGIGGERNWDYRFSWFRDSALTLNALYLLGYKDEASWYMTWLMKNCDLSSGRINILAPITEHGQIEEQTLSHFEGYKRSCPVRIGNAASHQLQLDIYGELLDCIYLYSVYGETLTPSILQYVKRLAELICQQWEEKDASIWEVRDVPCHYTYSKLMCWVGLDRAIRIAEEYGLDVDIIQLNDTKDTIGKFLMERCIDRKKQYFVQSVENHVADASNLLMSVMGFLPPTHHLVLNTIDQTIQQLAQNNMILRYNTFDGLEGSEGTFNLCTFWLAEALALAGRGEEALEYFTTMARLANHLGLYSEQTDQHTQSALGNFPQAFTHIGFINTALTLNKIEGSS